MHPFLVVSGGFRRIDINRKTTLKDVRLAQRESLNVLLAVFPSNFIPQLKRNCVLFDLSVCSFWFSIFTVVSFNGIVSSSVIR